MGKEENREVMGKVYREFSRQKYNKYKHQFPKMRESEIVSKIIREWDSLDPVAKLRLKKVYKQNRALPTDLSDSETAKKSDKADLTEHGSHKKEETSPNLAEEGITASEKDKTACKQQVEEQRRQSVAGKISPKSKCIGKESGDDYISFFRHFYQNYSREHPNWRPSQISKIIKLLWRKHKRARLAASKLSNANPKDSNKPKKPISGRTAFKKMKNLSAKDSCRLWKHLPHESRRYWEGEGQGRARWTVKEQSVKLRASNELQGRNLGFMSKVMIG